MRIFKTKFFARFARKHTISDFSLENAIRKLQSCVDLGGSVLKFRLARSGEGKSGGFRTVVLYRRGNNAYFVYGFAKNELDNIDKDDLRRFRALAKEMLSYGDQRIEDALDAGELEEIIYSKDTL